VDSITGDRDASTAVEKGVFRWRESLRPARVLSLGAGVQSTCVLLMSCRGDLPPLDAAVFADTQDEGEEVYANLEWLKGVAAAAGIAVIVRTAGDLCGEFVAFVAESAEVGVAEARRASCMPLFSKHPVVGKVGRLRRQCTRDYKIRVVSRGIREGVLGLSKGQHVPAGTRVDLWFGMPSEEATRRMRMSQVSWMRNVYPLVGLPDEYLLKAFSRIDCLAWLKEHYPDRVVPRSSCRICPFRSRADWRLLQRNPRDWAAAVAFDKAVRRLPEMEGDVFVHRTCVPLDEIDFTKRENGEEEDGEGDVECTGFCHC